MALDPVTAKLLIAGGTTLANGLFQQRSAAYNQKMSERNLALNYKYAMKAQQMAPVNEVYGLKAAGLSPTFANGAQGMAISSGASGTAQAPQIDPINLAMMSAQMANLQASADKSQAEAESIKIDNAIKEGENKTLGRNMAVFYKELAQNTTNEDLKKFYLEQSDYASRGDFTRGNYDAFIKYLDLQGKPQEAIERKLDKTLSAFIAEQRWNKAKGHTSDTSEFVRALSSLDARQSDLLAEQASKLISERQNVEKDTELIGEKITLTQEQVEQVKAAAAQMENTNVMEFINKGDYGRALLAMLLQVFSGLAGKGVSYVQ